MWGDWGACQRSIEKLGQKSISAELERWGLRIHLGNELKNINVKGKQMTGWQIWKKPGNVAFRISDLEMGMASRPATVPLVCLD